MNVVEIGGSAFSVNEIAGELIIPNSITVIEDFVFSYNKINKVTFEDTNENPVRVTQINAMAFAYNQLTGNFKNPFQNLHPEGISLSIKFFSKCHKIFFTYRF